MRPLLLTIFYVLALAACTRVRPDPVIAHIGQICDETFLASVSVHKDGAITHNTDEDVAHKECASVGEKHCVIVNACEAMRRIGNEEAKPPAHMPGTTDL